MRCVFRCGQLSLHRRLAHTACFSFELAHKTHRLTLINNLCLIWFRCGQLGLLLLFPTLHFVRAQVGAERHKQTPLNRYAHCSTSIAFVHVCKAALMPQCVLCMRTEKERVRASERERDRHTHTHTHRERDRRTNYAHRVDAFVILPLGVPALSTWPYCTWRTSPKHVALLHMAYQP